MIMTKFIERRRLEIFNVMTSFYILHGHKDMIVSAVTADMVMANLDALCGFTPSESVQARDMIFDASESGVIPDWVMKNIEKCCIKLSDIAAEYRGSHDQDVDMWLALYNLLEVDCLMGAVHEITGGNHEH